MSWNDWPHVRGTGGQVPWNTQVATGRFGEVLPAIKIHMAFQIILPRILDRWFERHSQQPFRAQRFGLRRVVLKSRRVNALAAHASGAHAP